VRERERNKREKKHNAEMSRVPGRKSKERTISWIATSFSRGIMEDAQKESAATFKTHFGESLVNA
jgi:hypothetical protein